MVQVFFMITEFINIILLINFVGAKRKFITQLPVELSNEMGLFERFKEAYNREYTDPKKERKGFNNFVKNLAVVNKLNKEHPGQIIAYQLNRYADLNPEEINDHFGIQIIPYDYMEHGNDEAIKREHRHQFLEDMHLYDLYEVDKLYKVWCEKTGKGNFTEKYEEMTHYYRFVKTVVETNNKKFAGEDVSLEKDADELREPNQYFFKTSLH